MLSFFLRRILTIHTVVVLLAFLTVKVGVLTSSKPTVTSENDHIEQQVTFAAQTASLPILAQPATTTTTALQAAVHHKTSLAPLSYLSQWFVPAPRNKVLPQTPTY